MGYFVSNDPFFLFKVIDCYYKKDYLKKNDNDRMKKAEEFMAWFDKEITKGQK